MSAMIALMLSGLVNHRLSLAHICGKAVIIFLETREVSSDKRSVMKHQQAALKSSVNEVSVKVREEAQSVSRKCLTGFLQYANQLCWS